ncbi:DNA repair protein RecO [Arthrobacter sp. MYb211]|uniref:DNA repair protein RecO n=1 Tax=unclassified Arthrobacter TaxID=235627 RepID=UPI000CFE323E|nr:MULTISPECIES: DNA repair protein RecO [unclassified Arthrobacter]PRA13858.1 DNA repair protein RecO [Arthrobacter sp. MYb221]PRC09228.1 DNA repair protein RecO [Arthrobacter sp. MYb211]
MSRSGFASRSYRTRGLVLRTHKLGEADRIITLITPTGLARAVAKGVRRTSSRLGATLEPFMEVDALIVMGRNLDVVSQAQLRTPYGQQLVTDYASYTVATAMVEIAEKLLEADADSTNKQYLLLHGAIALLSKHRVDDGAVLDSYILRALSIAGWAPSFTDCVRCGAAGPHEALNVHLGGVVCPACRPAGSLAPHPITIGYLQALLTGDWDTVAQGGPRAKKQAADIVASYLQWHLERAVKSLRHVERT